MYRVLSRHPLKNLLFNHQGAFSKPGEYPFQPAVNPADSPVKLPSLHFNFLYPPAAQLPENQNNCYPSESPFHFPCCGFSLLRPLSPAIALSLSYPFLPIVQYHCTIPGMDAKSPDRLSVPSVRAYAFPFYLNMPFFLGFSSSGDATPFIASSNRLKASFCAWFIRSGT